MKTTRAAFALTLILLGFLASEAAFARPYGHRGGVRLSLAVGVPIGLGYGYIGSPYYFPYYSPYYAPYYPPVVTVPYTPPTYIEQPAPQASPLPHGYWYYCAESNAYYPYVSQCAGGWQRVSPIPPPG